MKNTTAATGVSPLKTCTFSTIETLAKNDEGVNALQQNAERILGPVDYARVYDFFKYNFQQATKFDYIIVKARRAYMLAQIFGLILFRNAQTGDSAEEKDKNPYTDAMQKLHSDIFLRTPEFIANNTNVKLLILDDIIIHGRALDELLTYLIESNVCDASDIAVTGIVISKSAECISPNIKTCFKHELVKPAKSVEANEWKQLSNKFVMLIQYAGQSYAAFTDSFRWDDSYKPEEKFVYCTNDAESKAQLDAHIKMQVHYNKAKRLNSLNRCLRCYTQTEGKTATKIAIPFVSLPMLSLDKWRELYKCIPLFKDDRLNKVVNWSQESVDILAYKLVSNIASDLYAEQLGFTEATTNNLLGSFNLDITKHAVDLEAVGDLLYHIESNPDVVAYSDVTIQTDADVADFEAIIDSLTNIESVNLWRTVLHQHRSENITQERLRNMMTVFLDSLHSKNEQRAVKQQTRLPGIPIYALFVLLQYYSKRYKWDLNAKDFRDFYAYVISLWDVGIASYSVDVFTFNCEKYIDGCITDGEQAYHALMETDSSAEVFAVHLLTYYTHSTAEFQHKLQELLADMQHFDGLLDRQRLKYVCAYYETNHTVKELMTLYPADKKQRDALRGRITALCGC